MSRERDNGQEDRRQDAIPDYREEVLLDKYSVIDLEIGLS
jgi:hypothetical protein